MTTVKITELALRDAHQCLLATRLRTEDMLPICAKLDAVGYWACEVWGGATYDACLRFLKEDPWQRLRALRQAIPNTRLSMLLRGQNIVGYRHYADDVVIAFVDRAAQQGIDVFRIFDALNDTRNLTTAIKAVKTAKRHAQGAICYTVSPVHSIEQYVSLAKQMVDLGCDSIAIKDMAGLLLPAVAAELVAALQQAVSVPIHCHTHATAGVAAMSLLKVVEQGCTHIDTAISSLAEGASHTATESMVATLQNTPYDTGLDLQLLSEIADHFAHIRKKYHQFDAGRELDPSVHQNQIPGGMISNLINQLKEQQALDKLPAVKTEIPRVRQELGYPPLVTPSSQIVGTQAVLNVLTGERYKTITNEVKRYCQGQYGQPPAPIDPEVLKQAIGQAPVMTHRPADDLPDEMNGNEQLEIEDRLSLVLFPEVAKVFITERDAGKLTPEPLEPAPSAQCPRTADYQISVHGETYAINLTGIGHSQRDQYPVYLTVDGIPEEVLVLARPDQKLRDSTTQSGRAKATQPGHVTVAMPSTVIEVLVAVGDPVAVGDALFVTEAMKMQTEVQAPISGIIQTINIQKGDAVNPDEVLIEIV